MCNGTFTIPTWVKNGQYTIQWMWYGGGSWFGEIYKSQLSFVSCLDFTIAGTETVRSRPSCPAVFKGGDVHNPTNKNQCLYFKINGVKHMSPWDCLGGNCAGNYTSGLPYEYVECKETY